MTSPLEADDLQRDRCEDVLLTQRPWGSFQQFALNTPVTVKIITIEPRRRLSLQRHALRAELWQILDSTLVITEGAATRSAEPGEMIWLAQGTIHRVANPGPSVARILEVAFGHFDELDIERLHDDFDRC